MEKKYSFDDLQKIVAVLRSPSGCSWDRAQTHESLCTCMVEEAYEVADAVETYSKSGKTEDLEEELGDVLLQVVLQCRIAEEKEEFNFSDVVNRVAEKMVFRHPHVFPGKDGTCIPESEVDWESLKRKEKPAGSLAEEIDRIPHALPALIRTAKVQKKLERACPVEHSWREDTQKAEKKMRGFLEAETEEQAEEELGEALYALTDAARKRGINSEETLKKVLEKRRAGIDKKL